MGDYENHINRQFFQKLVQCCDCPVVEMGGDKFLLTIPSKTAYIDLEVSLGRKSEQLKALTAKNYPLFDIRYGNLFVFSSTMLQEESTPLAKADINGILPQDWGRISTKKFNFVPALVPLTRDGEVDISFAANMPTGERIRAGHLLLVDGTEMEKNSSRYFTREDGPIQLVENTDKEPLTWISAGGILICMDYVAKVQFAELWAAKLCPNLTTEIPRTRALEAEQAAPSHHQQTSQPLQDTLRSFGRHCTTGLWSASLPDGLVFTAPNDSAGLDALLEEALQQTKNDFPVGSLVNWNK